MKTRGFTLLEVIVATAVFAMMAAILAGAYVNVLRAYHALADTGEREAQLRFARAQFLAEASRDKAEEGLTVTDGETRVQWQADIQATTVPDLYRCAWSCTMQRPGAPKDDRVEEVFWLLRPSWAKPDERGPIEQALRERLLETLPAGTTPTAGGQRS